MVIVAYISELSLWEVAINQEKPMKCAVCRHGETALGCITATLGQQETIVVVREVPAQVCRQCGEYYLDETIANRVFALASHSVQRHAQVEIVHYIA
ncbi:MAG: type II toxin-antitoxin system MqsA family antitoxin [Magnetococcales bacterium]|nr:type II toxin-antitoxin system MqsA family antitoxin [Magnetococcales bacterium]